ncbi:MAG: CDP-alcohol phosphatidyltransferase family protein [Clostridia bacterium]|nr:CDP-alcohol phosphatidyltransferase family protein [Clostridia bacterium]
MLGFYNYTVILTYVSLATASTGIILSLVTGNPFIGVIALLFCGLCDAFDGKVARTKKDRTEEECRFGIQIDSLSDIIAFGVLPACIGASLIQRSLVFNYAPSLSWQFVLTVVFTVVMVLFVLGALIRLAYFNVTEEDRQREETGARKYYLGLPVTLGSLILPVIFTAQYLFERFFEVDLTFIYFIAMLIIEFAFVARFKLKKPGSRIFIGMVVLGCLELAGLIVALVI